LIAPLGKDRAELTFDPKTARLDLYLLGQSDARPRPTAADTVNAVVRVGTEATVVPLTPGPDPGGRAHFQGTASFLRGVPMFQAKVLVPQPGGPAVADFEPWIDTSLAAGTRTQAAYVCPMHPAVGS